MPPKPSELALLLQAAERAAAAAQVAAALAGVDTEALDTEALGMFRSSEQALHSWSPGPGWHW